MKKAHVMCGMRDIIFNGKLIHITVLQNHHHDDQLFETYLNFFINVFNSIPNFFSLDIIFLNFLFGSEVLLGQGVNIHSHSQLFKLLLNKLNQIIHHKVIALYITRRIPKLFFNNILEMIALQKIHMERSSSNKSQTLK